MADLKARPGLAKRIVGSHLLLGSNVRAQVNTFVIYVCSWLPKPLQC